MFDQISVVLFNGCNSTNKILFLLPEELCLWQTFFFFLIFFYKLKFYFGFLGSSKTSEVGQQYLHYFTRAEFDNMFLCPSRKSIL